MSNQQRDVKVTRRRALQWTLVGGVQMCLILIGMSVAAIMSGEPRPEPVFENRTVHCGPNDATVTGFFPPAGAADTRLRVSLSPLANPR